MNVDSDIVDRMNREHISQNVNVGTQDVRETIKESSNMDIDYKKELREKRQQ